MADHEAEYDDSGRYQPQRSTDNDRSCDGPRADAHIGFRKLGGV